LSTSAQELSAVAETLFANTPIGAPTEQDITMHIPRKIAVAVLAGVSVAGMAGASAASLGGLTAGQIGSEDKAVTSCDSTGIASAFTSSYNVTAQKYQVSAVNFTNVDPACNAKAASVTLRNTAGAVLTTQNVAAIAVAAAGTFSVPINPAVDASAIVAISVIISG
jgi:hypothetical protein